MKNILVIYYSQSGQLTEACQKLLIPFEKETFNIEYLPIVPETDFPFPWTSDSFFDSMPESVLEIPLKIKPLKPKNENVDFILLAYTSWYLSPSIPITSFLLSEHAVVLKDKPIVTLNACRNMWFKTHDFVRNKIKEVGGKQVGHIVLCDKSNNLVSVITIYNWMTSGKKEKYNRFFPLPGIQPEDFRKTELFGNKIFEYVTNEKSFGDLQKELIELGAVSLDEELMMIEPRAKVIFRKWASFILRKGKAGCKERLPRVHAFKMYLFTVIFLALPIATIVFRIINILSPAHLKRKIIQYTELD
jgi:hypothetical protein